MQPFAYIGPGGGVTVGALLVILIGGLVLFALGFIVWLRIERFQRAGQGQMGPQATDPSRGPVGCAQCVRLDGQAPGQEGP